LTNVVSKEPARFTAADRLEAVPSDLANDLIQQWERNPSYLASFFEELGETPKDINVIDGLRITLSSGKIAHFRPSGNAPELRIYVEAESLSAAEALLRHSRRRLAEHFPEGNPPRK
jgi:phosphomannomutase